MSQVRDCSGQDEPSGVSGNRAGLGRRPVIVVVDMARSVADGSVEGHLPSGVDAAAATAGLLTHARLVDVPILFTLGGKRWCTSSGSELSPSERGAWVFKSGLRDESREVAALSMELAPVLGARHGEGVIRKRAPSAFFGTPLVSVLHGLEADSLVLCGVTTSGCLRASVVDAFSFGYRVNVPRECVADKDGRAHEDSLRTMDRKYADVETVEEVLRRLTVSRGATRSTGAVGGQT